MKISEKINTPEETVYILDGGNLNKRKDVSFLEDLNTIKSIINNEDILQDPIKAFDLRLIYECQLTDESRSEYERLGFEPIPENIENEMYTMLDDDGFSFEEIAEKYNYDIDSVRYWLQGYFEEPFEIVLISIYNNGISILHEFWLGNEDYFLENIFKKLKDANELEFIRRKFMSHNADFLYFDHTGEDMIDFQVCRDLYNNPRWEEDPYLIIGLDDAPHLYRIQEEIGEGLKIVHPNPNDEEVNILDDLAIDYIAKSSNQLAARRKLNELLIKNYINNRPFPLIRIIIFLMIVLSIFFGIYNRNSSQTVDIKKGDHNIRNELNDLSEKYIEE